MSEAAHVTDRRDPPEAPLPRAPSTRGRRVVFRVVVVLQLNLFISGWLDFLLAPATLAAALLVLIWKSDRHGCRFYRVLDWGHRAEDALGLFAALEGDAEAIPSEPSTSMAGK